LTARARVLVEGRVQGVGYRYFAARAARELGVRGWVRNLADGRVEAYAAGRSAAVEAFVARLREGPPQGHVDRIEVLEAEGPEGEGFEIRM
jgi:acylphosphatase